jgi:hypothetical protein
MSLRDRRHAGDQSAFTVTVDFGETINLVPLTKTFTMYTLDFQTKPIDAQAATATDITAEAAGEGAPLLSVWELSYGPTGPEVATPGDFLGLFTILYAGAEPRKYPPGDEYLRVEIASA